MTDMYTIQKEINDLVHVAALLDWDEKTYMPRKGIESRTDAEALIEREIHSKFISDELLNAAKNISENSSEKDKIVAKRLLKDIKKERKLPTKFVEKLAKLTGQASQKWLIAKENKDYSIFKPFLAEIVEMKKEEAKLVGLPGHPYNSLIDTFEEGMTVEKLTKTFSFLKPRIIDLIKRINESSVKKKNIRLTMSIDKQKEISEIIRKMMTLSSDISRLDETEHPFTTTIGLNDVRITTHYKEDEPLSAFFSTVHEGGHALYELGLPEEYKDTVIHDAPSFGLHESQSRFWENMIARSKIFWKNNFSIFQQRIPTLNDISLDEWILIVNEVKPNLIRIESDEVSYMLHIILRFEIEKALIEGSLTVDELPRVWNKKIKEFIGIEPQNDSEGVLQDVHWSGGSFGYFPSYGLGTIYASQIYERMMSESNIKNGFENNDMKPIIAWLRTNIHKKGRIFSAEEIITQCCGRGLDAEQYFNYLDKKYSEIYKL